MHSYIYSHRWYTILYLTYLKKIIIFPFNGTVYFFFVIFIKHCSKPLYFLIKSRFYLNQIKKKMKSYYRYWFVCYEFKLRMKYIKFENTE